MDNEFDQLLKFREDWDSVEKWIREWLNEADASAISEPRG